MAGKISTETLENAARIIDSRIGFHFPRARHADLERALLAAAKDSECRSVERFVDLIASDDCPPSVFDSLVARVSIGETYFFRHSEQFEALKTHILPPLVAARRKEARLYGRRPRLSLWSAAGSTGEEAYSLAILLRGFLPDVSLWDISIASTDLNLTALARARRADYGQWSFRGVPESVQAAWFLKTDRGRLRVIPAVKAMVSFMKFNLADTVWDLPAAGIPEPDIVFCRNVLLYFSRTGIDAVLRRLLASVAPGGWLVVGPSEAMSVFNSGFDAVSLAGTTLFRKPGPGSGAGTGQGSDPASAVKKAAVEAATDATVHVMPESEESITALPGFADYSEARRLADAGRLADARRFCDMALVADRTNPDYQYLHALLDLESGHQEPAAATLRRVLFLRPEFIMAHYTLGNVEAMRGNHGESMRHYRNALARLGDHADTEILPESDCIPAGRLALIISRKLNGEA